ncbi:MAG: ribosome hibernation-promoting factor, HPF/YfiA family [Candidatus Glassbacteria bacterium]
MEITISTRHCDISDQTKSYIDREMNGLERFYNRIMGADVTLITEKHRQIAEIKLKINQGTLYGKAESSDMRTSFDQAVEKLVVQLKKHKESRRQRKGSRDRELMSSRGETETAYDEELFEEE